MRNTKILQIRKFMEQFGWRSIIPTGIIIQDHVDFVSFTLNWNLFYFSTKQLCIWEFFQQKSSNLSEMFKIISGLFLFGQKYTTCYRIVFAIKRGRRRFCIREFFAKFVSNFSRGSIFLFKVDLRTYYIGWKVRRITDRRRHWWKVYDDTFYFAYWFRIAFRWKRNC